MLGTNRQFIDVIRCKEGENSMSRRGMNGVKIGQQEPIVDGIVKYQMLKL